MKKNILALLLTCVFFTQTTTFESPLPPIAADDTWIEITANTIRDGLVSFLTAVTNPKTIPTALFNVTVLPVWEGAKAHPLPATIIAGTFIYLVHKRIQAHKLATATKIFFDHNATIRTANPNIVDNITQRADKAKLPWYWGGGWIF